MFSGSPEGKNVFKNSWEFPGDPVVRTLLFHCTGPDFDGRGTRIPNKLHGGGKKKFSHIFIIIHIPRENFANA